MCYVDCFVSIADPIGKFSVSVFFAVYDAPLVFSLEYSNEAMCDMTDSGQEHSLLHLLSGKLAYNLLSAQYNVIEAVKANPVCSNHFRWSTATLSM